MALGVGDCVGMEDWDGTRGDVWWVVSEVSLRLSVGEPPCMDSLSSCVAERKSGDGNDNRGGLETGGCVGGDEGMNGAASAFSGE